MKPAASLVGVLSAMTIGWGSAQAQRVVTGGSFTPAANVLFATTFSQDSVGSFPSGLKFVRGPLDVVLVGGVPMLRAIGEAEFQIPLGQPLPQDFTLEFDLIPKAGNGDDLTIEGGPVASRGSVSSAEIRFNHQIASIMGGGQGMSQVTLPYDLQTELINQRSTVQMAMNGTQFKLFVNGRQIYNIPNLAFRRAAALRVFVGGRDDATNAVYLARIRLATSGQTAVAVVPVAPPTATVTPMPPPTQPATGTPRTGSILSGGPTTKLPLTVVQPPPSISTTPAAYNQPNQLPVAQSSQGQTTTPPAPSVAGPTQLAGIPWPYHQTGFGISGLGVMLAWDPVPGAASYRIYRAAVGSMLPGLERLAVSEPDATNIVTEMMGAGAATATNNRAVVDPLFDAPSIYWVDAVFSNGSFSGLSPSFTFVPPSSPIGGLTFPAIKNLTTVAGQPTTVMNPWSSSVQPGPGRIVTWTWTPMAAAVLYEVSLTLGAGTAPAAVPPYNETLLASAPPLGASLSAAPTPSVLAPFSNRGYRTGPPFSIGIPSGVTVGFCVSLIRPPGGTLAQAPFAACNTVQVP